MSNCSPIYPVYCSYNITISPKPAWIVYPKRSEVPLRCIPNGSAVTCCAAWRGWAPPRMASTARREGRTRIITSPSPICIHGYNRSIISARKYNTHLGRMRPWNLQESILVTRTNLSCTYAWINLGNVQESILATWTNRFCMRESILVPCKNQS